MEPSLLTHCNKTKNNKEMWFVTKQSLKDFYFIMLVAGIVKSYSEISGEVKYREFYFLEFTNGTTIPEKYRNKEKSKDQYRNTIIGEYLGLINREKYYASSKVTSAYECLNKYIKSAEDIDKYSGLVEKQVEKVVFNLIEQRSNKETQNSNYIFPFIFLYKILLLLDEEYGDSTLTYNEFVVFVIRFFSYYDFEKCLNLIKLSRKDENKIFFNKYIEENIIREKDIKNIRFTILINYLPKIEYKKLESFSIKGEHEKKNMIKVIELFRIRSIQN